MATDRDRQDEPVDEVLIGREPGIVTNHSPAY